MIIYKEAVIEFFINSSNKLCSNLLFSFIISGYKKPQYGGHAEPEAAPAPEPHADHEGHVEGHQWAEE